MEKDILIWILGGLFATMLVMWNSMYKALQGVEFRSSKGIDDLSAKLDRDKLELNNKIDRAEAKLSARLDMKIDPIEKDIIQINTRLAIMETRISDIGTNVTYLMWHNQALPPRDEIKEN